MKRTFLSLALLLPLTAAAHADDASKRAKITELLTVMKVDQVGKQITDGAGRQAEQIGKRQFGAAETPDQQKQVEELHQQVLAVLTPAVDWKTLQPEYVTLYNATYTEPEIDSILAFYKSPGGQALLNKGQEVGQKSGQIIQTHIGPVQPQLQQIVQNFIAKSTPAGTPSSGSGIQRLTPNAPSSTTPSTAPARPAPSLSTPAPTTTTPPAKPEKD